MHGDIGYKFCWLLSSKDHTQGTPARHESVHCIFIEESMCPINDTITFPPINVNRVLQSHEDNLILTLGVGRFDVWRILVNPSSSANLLQMSAYRKIGYSPFALKNLGHFFIWIQWSYNNFPRWCCVAHLSRPDHIECVILGSWWSVFMQCHYRTCMASQNESHSF